MSRIFNRGATSPGGKMKSLLTILVGLLFCGSAGLCYSQENSSEVKPLLQDALYAMNRFDEVAKGLDVEIQSWMVDDSSKAIFRRELAATLINANRERPRLAALLAETDVSSTDLFDVYSELEGIASELDGQASNASNWGTESRGMELAQLGGKTLELAARIGLTLRAKIASQEAQLKACTQKPVSKTH